MSNNRSAIEVLGFEQWEALKAKGAIMASLGEKDNFTGSLLFAGSDTQTIGNRWKNVKEIGGLD